MSLRLSKRIIQMALISSSNKSAEMEREVSVDEKE